MVAYSVVVILGALLVLSVRKNIMEVVNGVLAVFWLYVVC